MQDIVLKFFALISQLAYYLSGSIPKESLHLPITFEEIAPEPLPNYQRLPAIIVSDMNTYIFLLRILDSSNHLKSMYNEIETTMCFLTIVMGWKSYCSDTGIRSDLIMIFDRLISSQAKENLGHMYNHSPFMLKQLISAMINIFIDSEHTGRHQQFYEKFRFRNQFCNILEYLIEKVGNQQHQYNLVKFGQENPDRLIEFANYYLNDIIYLFDEVIENFSFIKKLEQLPKEQQTASLEKDIKSKYSYTKTLTHYLNQYFKNFNLLCSTNDNIFLNDILIQKFANFLNYMVISLNSPNSAEKYKVSQMQELRFDTKIIMQNAILIYNQFKNNAKFKK